MRYMLGISEAARSDGEMELVDLPSGLGKITRFSSDISSQQLLGWKLFVRRRLKRVFAWPNGHGFDGRVPPGSAVHERSLVIHGSTVTSTYDGTLSAPFLSVTRSLNRNKRVSETWGAVNEGSGMFTSSNATLLPRTWLQL